MDQMTNMYIANIGSREKMEEYFNKTSSQIREALRENAREGLKVQRMQQKLVGEIKITPAEVRRHFKDLPQDSIPYIPTQVEVQIITQQPKIPLEEIEDVKSRLREYTDRVNKGESFSMLARLYSDDRGTAINGGEMPFTGRGYLDPAFANVAFNLQDPNKVSKIVESEYGFHIIQLMEKRGDRIKVRHILLKPHVPEEALMAGTARLDSIADDIRNGKFTFEEAASVLSQDKDTRNNHGLLPNPYTYTSLFGNFRDVMDLTFEVRKASSFKSNQTGSTCHQRFFRYVGLQQDMAYFDTVTTFFHQLDNMEAIFRLYNLGNLIGVLQVESHIGKCRIQITASCKWHFTTIDSRTTVVGVQTCQHREAFSLIHTIRIFAQTTFYIFNFLQRNFRLLCDDLHLYLGRDIRNTVLRQILEVTAHLCGSDFNLSYQFLLHSLHFQSFTGILAQGFTNLTGCLIEVFLHLFTRTDIGDIHIRHLVHTLDHLTFSNFNTIKSSLVQKQSGCRTALNCPAFA